MNRMSKATRFSTICSRKAPAWISPAARATPARLQAAITAINELSSTLIIYDSGTITMPVKIYLAVLDGEFGLAAALSTILLLLSGICVYAVFRFAEGRETAFV